MNVTTAQGLSDKLPSGCSVRVNASSKSAQLFFNGNNRSLAGCGGPGHSITGRQETALATLGLLMDPVGNNVTITISGPADVWFGIGFDTQYMANAPYTIVVDGKGGVTERVLGEHVAGILLNRSVDLAGHLDGIRTVTHVLPQQKRQLSEGTFSQRCRRCFVIQVAQWRFAYFGQ